MPRASRARIEEAGLAVRYEEGFQHVIRTVGVTTDRDVLRALWRLSYRRAGILRPAEPSTIAKVHEAAIEG